MTFEEYLKGLNQAELEIIAVLKSLMQSHDVKTVLEIGSGWGVTARTFLEYGTTLYTIDKQRVLPEFDQRTQGFEKQIYRMCGDSKEILPTLVYEKHQFDLVYVDGSHHYEDALADMRNATLVLRKGGIIVCDDFWHNYNWTDQNYGVNKAVRDFIRERNITYAKVYFAGNGTVLLEP